MLGNHVYGSLAAVNGGSHLSFIAAFEYLIVPEHGAGLQHHQTELFVFVVALGVLSVERELALGVSGVWHVLCVFGHLDLAFVDEVDVLDLIAELVDRLPVDQFLGLHIANQLLDQDLGKLLEEPKPPEEGDLVRPYLGLDRLE